MFNLTKQERLVLIALSFVFLFGSMVHYALKNEKLNEALRIIDGNKIYPKVDLKMKKGVQKK